MLVHELATSRPLVVLDLDGTLVAEGTDEIAPEVAAAVLRVAQRWAVVIVTARASERAVLRAERTLASVGLGDIPLVHRDRRRHDDSASGLIASKCELIEKCSQEAQVRPVVGVGDRETDALAYARLGMVALNLEQEPSDAWSRLPEQIARAISE